MSRHTEAAIIREQAGHIHRNLLTCSVLAMVSAVIVTLIFSGAHNAWQFGAFLVIVLLMEANNLRRWRNFRRRLDDVSVAAQLLKTSIPWMALSSTLWGAAIYLIFPGDRFTLPLTFFCAILANTAAATFYFGPYYPTFVATALPMALIGIAGIVAQGTLYHPAFFGLMSFFPPFMLFAWRFNRLILTTHQLRFANLDLVEQLTVQKERAELATLAKSRFLAAASHDLRQPMHALNLYLGALSAYALPEHARRPLANARLCADTMDEMIRSLLDISRLDASVMPIAISDFPVAHLLDRIRMEFTPQAEAKGLCLRVVDCSAFLRSDPMLLTRILRNLVSNAVRYTTRGSILVGCRRRGGKLVVQVHDTGPGIALEQQHAVFEEFYQLGGKQQGFGLGLGLAIVKRLADLLAAPLALHSAPGDGSCFAITLPTVAPELAHMLGHKHGIERSDALAGLLVVIVDDEPTVLDAAANLLGHWGCTVVAAESGAHALAQLSTVTRVPDAIVCDYHLRSGEDGVAVVAALRMEFNQAIPALFVTGDTDQAQIHALAGSGLPVLHKPLSGEELQAALLTLIAGRPSDTKDTASLHAQVAAP
jgi:signal transduction histidine kinase/CheY-like chemotaxis protein